jgi:hypothetical protein
MSGTGKRPLVALAWLALCGISSAAECRLDHAVYTEEQSGAVIQFHPKDVAEHGIMVVGLFDLNLPSMAGSFAGDIAWRLGRYARSDGAISQPCTDEQRAENPKACWLWTGNVYIVGNETVELFEDADVAAPQAILLADFGRSLLRNEAFHAANDRAVAFDLFRLTGCAP